MMRRLMVLVGLMLLSMTAAQAGPNEDAVAARANWEQVYNSGDADKFVALYTKDAMLFGTTAQLFSGSDGVRTYFSKLPAGIKVKMGDQQAIAAGRAELSGGSSGRVTALARSASPVLQRHLSMLQQLGGGRIATGTTAGTGDRPASQSGWARPAARILTVLGLVLIAFAALFPGRSGPGGPWSAGPPQPPQARPPLPRRPERCPAPPMSAALPVVATATRAPEPRYPATWRHLVR